MVDHSEQLEAGSIPIEEHQQHLAEFDQLLSPDDDPLEHEDLASEDEVVDAQVDDRDGEQSDAQQPDSELSDLLDDPRQGS